MNKTSLMLVIFIAQNLLMQASMTLHLSSTFCSSYFQCGIKSSIETGSLPLTRVHSNLDVTWITGNQSTAKCHVLHMQLVY